LKYKKITIMFFLISVLLFSNVTTQADAITSSVDDPLIIFEKIIVEDNPVPNQPFTITVTVSTPARQSDLFLYLKVPDNISILSPIVAELDAKKSNLRSGTWTLLTSEPGSYPLDIIATSNNPPETTTFDFNLSIGTINSLVVTDVIIPGSLSEQEIFQVGTTLKNTGIVQDENFIMWLAVPDSLQILGPVSMKRDVINAQEEITYFWQVKSFKPGSYPVSFHFSSQNSGSGFLETHVNIGNKVSAELQALDMTIHGMNSTDVSISPGEKNVPLTFNLKNHGTSSLYDISSELVLNPPFNRGTSSSISNGIEDDDSELLIPSKVFQIGQLGIDQTREINFKVDVDEDTNPGLYNVELNLQYSDGQEEYNTPFNFNVKVTDNPIKLSAVTVIDPPVNAGDTATEINIELLNTGSTLYDVTAQLELPEGISPSWGDSDRAFFGKIESSETIVGQYFIDIDEELPPNEYSALVLMSSEELFESIVDFDLTVNPKAVFQIVGVEDSQLFRGSVNVPFRITLQNTGSEIAENVQTKLLGGNKIPGVKSSQITTLGDEENIGNVLPGESFTTTFFISLDPEADTGVQNTSVEISWSGNSDEEFSQNLNVTYEVPSGPSFLLYYGGIPFTYVIIGGIIVIGLIFFILERTKRMKFLQLATNQKFLTDEYAVDTSKYPVKEN
jgi:hypothetical protein